MNKDSLGDRMKSYEKVTSTKLIRRMPIIIRLDGKAFHTFTKGMDKPYDERFIKTMQLTAQYLQTNIQGCKLAYVQSDEISLLLVDYDTFDTQSAYDSKLQKLVSITASMATMAFNNAYNDIFDDKPRSWAMFDSRAFNLTKEEVCNYFIWRQQDWVRNSIQMLGQSLYSQKQLNGVNMKQLQNKMFTEKGVNWNDESVYLKRGTCVFNKQIDYNIPIFSKERGYINQFVYLETE